MRIFVGIFFIMHALVHLLYVGLALRFFELRPGLTWPDGAWAFSRLFGDPAARWLAAVSLALAALGFVIAGIGLLLRQEWWPPITTGAALLSTLIFFLFWDAKFPALPDKGGVGLLINLAILVITMLFKLPR